MPLTVIPCLGRAIPKAENLKSRQLVTTRECKECRPFVWINASWDIRARFVVVVGMLVRGPRRCLRSEVTDSQLS
jgi:hypothetical protein